MSQQDRTRELATYASHLNFDNLPVEVVEKAKTVILDTIGVILAWNDYIFTRILITSDELKTLPVGVQDLFHSALIDWGLIMAAGMMITIPALLFFVAVQRYLIRGWGAGAVKG